MKLKIDFDEKKSEDDDENDSQKSVNQSKNRLDDIDYNWEGKTQQSGIEDQIVPVAKGLKKGEKVDKGSINFWMMLLQNSVNTATDSQVDLANYDKKTNALYNAPKMSELFTHHSE